MKHRRLQRGALLLALGFRLLLRHSPTLLSAAVIATLAVIAMSSDAFRSSGRAAELPASLRDVPDGEDIGMQVVQSILWSPPQAELGLRSFVYYIYEDEWQREMFERGLSDLSRARFKLDEGGPEDTNVFVRAATPQEADAAEQEITEAEEFARSQGYKFQVVDLRQD